MRSIIKRFFCGSVVFLFCQFAYSIEYIWQDGSDYVGVESVSNNELYEHPANIDYKNLARILSHVEILDKSSKKVSSKKIFTDKEVDILARKVSEALKLAKKDTVIVYSISDTMPAYIGNQRLYVSGSIFVSNNKLNLIFGEVHVDIQKKYMRSGASVSNSRFASDVELSSFRLNNGNTREQNKTTWKLREFSGALAVSSRDDWLKIDLNRDYDYLNTHSSITYDKNQYLSESQKASLDSGLELRIQKIEKGQRMVDESDIVIIKQLRLLKSLRNDGAITEKVYQDRVRSVADGM